METSASSLNNQMVSEQSVEKPANLNTEELASSALVETEANNLATFDSQNSSWLGSIFGTVSEVTSVVGNAVIQAGETIAGTAVSTGGVIINATVQAGETITEAAVNAGGVISNATVQTTNGVGYLLEVVDSNPLLQELTKAFTIDWLINVIDRVDVVKAETEVKRLQQKYPHEKSDEIAHRIIVEKAVVAGGSGLASSLLPGTAAAMFAVDLAATTLLQAEMVYQIAYTYGLNLKDPARKGEVLAIFGLSLGGSQLLKTGSQYAIKAGLGFLQNIPVAGAVIGASTNALMLYTLGYSACRFYEAKINPLVMEAQLEKVQAKGEKYLQEAIFQEVIMDQILVYVFLAENPNKSWESILPELQTFNFSLASLETISRNIKSPPTLETLLDQINQDFAIVLLAQCNKIIYLDGVITPDERKIMEIITKKFDVN